MARIKLFTKGYEECFFVDILEDSYRISHPKTGVKEVNLKGLTDIFNFDDEKTYVQLNDGSAVFVKLGAYFTEKTGVLHRLYRYKNDIWDGDKIFYDEKRKIFLDLAANKFNNRVS